MVVRRIIFEKVTKKGLGSVDCRRIWSRYFVCDNPRRKKSFEGVKSRMNKARVRQSEEIFEILRKHFPKIRKDNVFRRIRKGGVFYEDGVIKIGDRTYK